LAVLRMLAARRWCMDADVRAFGKSFADHLKEGDVEAAHGMLAEWLRSEIPAEELNGFIGVENPVEFEVDGNNSDYDTLKEPDGQDLPTRPFDTRITKQNFRQWMCIQLIPDEESDDPPVDVWMAVVNLDGQLRIGYLEATGAD
jgi:hypothetical protein